MSNTRITVDNLPGGAVPGDKYELVANPVGESHYQMLRDYSIIFPDFAQNIGNLQNTIPLNPRIDIDFMDSTSDSKKQKLANRIAALFRDFWERVYPSGQSGFTTDVVGQIARYGAGSVEWVLERKRGRVEYVVLVPVEDIHFKRKPDGKFIPYQKVRNHTLLGASSFSHGYIALDVPTYTYVPIETLESCPYGIPPFLSALVKLDLQRDIMNHLGDITKKIGLMGFLSILARAPMKRSSESDTDYTNRCQDYVNSSAKSLTANMSKGVVVGLKDSMELEYHNVSGDSTSTASIVQIVEEQIASAFKSDPAMFGRSYSTTETYAGVVYDKFINMLDHYTAIVSKIMRVGLMMELRFEGLLVDDIRVIFNKPKSLTAKIDADAENVRLDTILRKRDAGIIDQTQAAKELGYDKPASPTPLDIGEKTENREQVQRQRTDYEKTTMSFSFDEERGLYSWRRN